MSGCNLRAGSPDAKGAVLWEPPCLALLLEAAPGLTCLTRQVNVLFKICL